MTVADVFVILFCVGLALRSATRLRQIRKAESAESPRAESGAPRSSPLHEAAHPIPGVPGVVYQYRGDFDRKRMVQMLREQGYIDEARARDLLEDA
jgi:hypothetical protein